MNLRILFLCIIVFSGCTESNPLPVYSLDHETILKPESCLDCHKNHYEQWSGSMHAYASKDPVFLAMNARGQRETNGELGDFCVKCHAPMALKLGLTVDGLNLPDLPDHVQGVTCYFCHSVESVDGSHNADLSLANDQVMRGSYINPVENTAHASAYSSLLDRDHIDSASLCGTCHDIVTQKGVHLERTYQEWQDSLFSHPNPNEQATCGNCHMPGKDDTAADYPGVLLRRVHDHKMAGVDIALDPFPQQVEQKAEVQRLLDFTIFPELCVVSNAGQTKVTLTLENIGAGHSWPSGAAHDRRAWVELIAYDSEDNQVFATGIVPDGVALRSLDDPHLWEFGDRGFDEEGNEVHMFWEIASIESDLLPAPAATSFTDPDYIDTHRTREFLVENTDISRVSVRVRIRPMGLDMIDDLIQSGDLDPAVRDKIPTFTLGYSELEWSLTDAVSCIPSSP